MFLLFRRRGYSVGQKCSRIVVTDGVVEFGGDIYSIHICTRSNNNDNNNDRIKQKQLNKKKNRYSSGNIKSLMKIQARYCARK